MNVQRIGLRSIGVMPTVDIAHYEYHLTSGTYTGNSAIPTLIEIKPIRTQIIRSIVKKISSYSFLEILEYSSRPINFN